MKDYLTYSKVLSVQERINLVLLTDKTSGNKKFKNLGIVTH